MRNSQRALFAFVGNHALLIIHQQRMTCEFRPVDPHANVSALQTPKERTQLRNWRSQFI